MVSFFGSLAVLLVVLIVVRLLGAPKKEDKEIVSNPKSVPTYQVGQNPTITVQAKIEKSGVITVVAQTSGVVREIKAYEGNSVRSGQVLVNLSSTYGGANAAGLQRQIAEKSYQNNQDNLQSQLDIIAKRRELAEKTDGNADQLRNLSKNSLDRTRDQLALNENILDTISTNLQTLESSLPANDALILSTKQQKAQALSAVNGLKDAVANLDYSTNADQPVNRLSDLGREISLKGLALEEKGLRLSLEISELNLKLARVSEAIYYPQAPFAGTVERVFVKPGQMVQPGMPLMTLVGSQQTMKAVALVSGDVAKKVSRLEVSKIYLPSGTIEQIPQYVATEPTDGNLFAITWCQLDRFAEQLANQEYVNVEIAVGYSDSLASTPYLPLDSIFQTQDQAYVFILEGENGQGTVVSRPVKLGPVFGSFVQIEDGLSAGAEIILDRTVVSGDQVIRK